MAWNDGVTKQLNDFLNELTEGGKVDIGETYIASVKAVIDDAVDSYGVFIKDTVPVDTGELKNSFVIEKIENRKNWYGYNAEFKGIAKNGTPYQKIANILNYGVPGKFAGTYFITRAIRRLKGMDQKIEHKFIEDLNKKTKGV